jgi:glutathione S-transferase
MQLFYAPFSPYARKCRVVVLEKNLADQVELMNYYPLDNPPELIAANPLARVPSLLLDDGSALCESPVICEYLDSLSPINPLYPTEHKARFAALGLAALADGVMEAAVACVMEGRRPVDKQYPAWVERKEAAVMRGIAAMAKDTPPADAPFTIGTLAAVVALEYVTFRCPHLRWREAYRALAKWQDDIAKRPSLAATAPAS